MTDNTNIGTGYVVWVNEDLTEGRGPVVPIAVCIAEATARRLAHKADVQGTNGTVKEQEIFQRGSTWYGPVKLIRPSQADLRAQEKLDRRNEIVRKAYAAGLSDEDIALLRGG